MMLFSGFRRSSAAALCFLCLAQLAHAAPIPNAIVVGFVGGFVSRANAIHNEVRLAERLSQQAGVTVLMFENRHGGRALQQILGLLDANRNGALSEEERSRARIVIYGHRWGASETVTLARALGRDRIPVLLTVQVDSVRKPGENDSSIPANVSQAVNFFQRDGLLHGRAQIHAADATRTEILGNFQYGYKRQPADVEGYPWYARWFMRPHIEIESDPAVWLRVEEMIRARIGPDSHQ